MSAFDTHPEDLAGDSSTLQSRRVWQAAGRQDLDFESQALRSRLRAKMFGVDATPLEIGRFTVLETVGSGGMGVVYAAHDRELDRRVAVKLLRPAREDDASVGKGRLQREAQALAKLSHPNVVQVYEVGTFKDRVFLAMEFLPGPTLRSWLMDEPRPWADVLRHFVEAGRGLAAAHQHGVIHRDFKPANLLFGGDGRVRVVDFGLARAAGEIRRELLEASPAAASSSFATELTLTGEIMGTPAYMSPEQARHETVDARSDQYSFCVALYEGLFGMRPHVGRSTAEVLVAVAEGEVRPPPRNTRVPGRVVRAVMRGLSAEPDQRFPSMDALLDELVPRDRGRWRLLGGATAVVVAGLGMFALASEPPCPSFEDDLEGAWGPEPRAAVAAAFGGAGAVGGQSALELARERLDAYAREWLDARRDVCEAHLVRREQSAELHDRRVACLVERRAELATLTRAFAAADVGVVEQAPLAAAELTAISDCGDLARLQRQGHMDPARQELRLRLAEARAQYKVGQYEPALTTLAAVAEEAHALAAPELEGAALFHRGSIHLRRRTLAAANEAFDQAVDLAEAGGDDELAAEAWSYLARIQAGLGHIEQADQSVRRARAKARRLGEDRLEQEVRESQAVVAWQADRIDEAIQGQALVVDGVRAALGDEHPRTADAEQRLANMLSDAGRHADAQARYAQALAVLERTLGHEHPELARVWFDMGVDHRDAGRNGEAVQALEHAERLFEAAVGARAPEQLDIHELLSDLAVARGDLDEAKRRADLALELAEMPGVPASERLDALILQANVAVARLDPAAAVRSGRAVLELLASGSFSAHDQLRGLYTRLVLAEQLRKLGRHAEAETEAKRLLAELEHHDDASLAPLRAAASKAAIAARQAREATIRPASTNGAPR
jgi:tetratricopeptide (TPR) repeat protein/predicted Ser/Thr protein kinase